MPTALSTEEQAHWNEIFQNLDKHVAHYRKEKEEELAAGKRKKLEEERDKIKQFLDDVQEGKASTIMQEEAYEAAKLKVLEELLKE